MSIAAPAHRLLPCLLFATAGACAGTEGSAPEIPASLVVLPAEAEMGLGDSRPFTARVLDKSGAPLAAQVSWSSGDIRLATVDPAGQVRAVAPGNVAITARHLGLMGAAAVTVRDDRPPTVTILSPEGGSEASGRVSVSVSAEDDHRISRLVLSADGVTAQTLSPSPPGGVFALEWDATAAEPGTHLLVVDAFDPSGNESADSLVLRVDPPSPPPTATCAIYPPDNPWNTDISGFPRSADSDRYIARLSHTWRLSFANTLPINVIHRIEDGVPMVPVTYTGGGDPGPMPIPPDALFQIKDTARLVPEDNHLVVLDNADCRLYELWSVKGPNPDGSWTAGNGAIFDLNSNNLRPDHLASSSASGLPVFVGTAREDETRAGAITHALSIPATLTQEGFIRPATTWQPDAVYQAKLPLVCATEMFPFKSFCAMVEAGVVPLQDPFNAPMGLRLRLKADYDLSALSGEALVILTALKKYGLMVTDGSGTAGMIRGEQVRMPHTWDWPASLSAQLSNVPATAFEVVETGPILR